MTADRHLGAAALPMLRPNLLITEATYATTVHDSRREREREFLRVVHDTVVARGGKVLIPAYGVGRAQELALILDEYWERMDLKVPIYFSSGSVAKVNVYHKLLLSWASEGSRERGIEKFDLRHIRNFDRSVLDSPGPCVLFAAPAMLHSGLSLEAFVKWAGDHKNTVILPEYCVAGTVGGKLAAGHRSRLEVNSRTRIDVHCAVKCINFSGHADAGGIMRLIRQCSPGSVMLVHGEKDKMNSLRMRIERNNPGIVCHVPSNGTLIEVETGRGVPVEISPKVVSEAAAVAPRIELRRTRGREAESPEDVAAAADSTALQFRPVPAGSRAMHGTQPLDLPVISFESFHDLSVHSDTRNMHIFECAIDSFGTKQGTWLYRTIPAWRRSLQRTKLRMLRAPSRFRTAARCQYRRPPAPPRRWRNV